MHHYDALSYFQLLDGVGLVFYQYNGFQNALFPTVMVINRHLFWVLVDETHKCLVVCDERVNIKY